MNVDRKRRNETLDYVLGITDSAPGGAVGPAPGNNADDAADLSALRATVAGLRGLTKHEPARDLAPEILARISSEKSESASFFAIASPRIWLAAAAVILCLAGSGVLVFRAMNTGSGTTGAGTLAASTRWLIAAQENDGSWNPGRWGGRNEYTVALTGIAMMALATPGSGAISPDALAARRRAAEFIATQQGKDGSFGPPIDARLYNHGIATAALLTAAPAGEPGAREVVDRAIGFILARQNTEGAWGYAARDGAGAANTSITVWQVRALQEARGPGRPDLDAAVGRAVRWLAAMVDSRGQFGYEAPGDVGRESRTLIAMGASCMMDRRLHGVEETLRGRVRQALVGGPAETGLTDFYRDYFLVDALEKAGDAEALTLAESIRNTMTARRGAGEYRDGSWTPDERWGRVGGRVYSTALAALSLNSGRRM